MSSRPMLTQREAAHACGVSRTTIRRRREAGELPGSVQDEQRGWLIPVEDLLAAGFRLNAPTDPNEPATAPATVGGHRQEQPSDVAGLRAELERARHERALAEAEHGRLLAETEAKHLRALLAARDQHLGDLRQALAALMPAPDRAVLNQSTAVPAQTRDIEDTDQVFDEIEAEEERHRWRRRQ
ncbi:helix-turn-helix transcriptional regulator [Streptomyces sp. NPDC091040]|uniref:helix-turn-helix transcriptional regulator n=1 Tax=Streptomyces sp. NPDC091040 TaxID=3365972 RepID=UPI003810692E